MNIDLRDLLQAKQNNQNSFSQTMVINLVNDLVNYVVSEHTTEFYINNVKHYWFISHDDDTRIWFKTNDVKVSQWLSTINLRRLSLDISQKLEATCNVSIINDKFILKIE